METREPEPAWSKSKWMKHMAAEHQRLWQVIDELRERITKLEDEPRSEGG
jgi:hypothetical protein